MATRLERMQVAVDRGRMALAEVGYDPSGLWLDPERGPRFNRNIIPRDVAWQARLVVQFGRPVCRVCFLAFAAAADCWAVSHHERDCGRPERKAKGAA